MRKIGILGGGQLARMLVLAGHELGLSMHVLSEKADDPAACVCPQWQQGKLNQIADLKSFLKKIDILTFESEFVDINCVQTANEDLQIAVEPALPILESIQDRSTQKKLLVDNLIPTAPYLNIDTLEHAEIAFSKFKKVVFKKRRFGYDGYGTFLIRNHKEFENFRNNLWPSISEYGLIAEELISFEKECALMIARNTHNEFSFFPLVESKQLDGKCHWVKGPLKATPHKIQNKFKRLMKKINYVGILGVELFQTKSGFVVNELAPRVHNSAHYSIEALSESQFVQHLKAILGEKLTNPNILSPFSMVNLLGQSSQEPEINLTSNTHLHWYQKPENRKGRKMGHITVLGKNADLAHKLALKASKAIKL